MPVEGGDLQDALNRASQNIGKVQQNANGDSEGIVISPGTNGLYTPLEGIGGLGNTNPLTDPTPVSALGGTRGFLPPRSIPPTSANSNPPLSGGGLGGLFGGQQGGGGNLLNSLVSNTTRAYRFYDWTGQRIEKRFGINNEAKDLTFLDPQDRFNASKKLPKTDSELKKEPYSTRDFYTIFNDKTTDYFKHGIQVVQNLNPLPTADYFETKNSEFKLSSFKGTPFENQDPVMFGFEIIIDSISSPLLNGGVSAFLGNYGSINEVASRVPVYEDFKHQFQKFFKTNAPIKINQDVSLAKFASKSGKEFNLTFTNESETNPATTDGPSGVFNFGKKAYLGFYLKGIKGLDKLVESNLSDKKKYLADYQKEFITLEFTEDVSLSIGALAHLYKLLYWSKPNGKGLVPENLLRFNCDIIVSECRNFNRVRKSAAEGNIQVVKDNLSRYVYSLRECQFYFDKMPHDGDIDLSSIKTFDNYSITFDYKYSTVKMERFQPLGTSQWGTYVGLNGGAIWKIGNPGARDPNDKKKQTDAGSAVPSFVTIAQNKYNQNGILGNDRKPAPFIFYKYGKFKKEKDSDDLLNASSTADKSKPGGLATVISDKSDQAEKDKDKTKFQKFKDSSKENARKAKEKAKQAAVDKWSKTKETVKDPNFWKKVGNVALNAARNSITRQLNGNPLGVFISGGGADPGEIRKLLLQRTLNAIRNAPPMGPANIYLNDGDRSNNTFPKHMPKNPLWRPPRNIYTEKSPQGFSALYYDVRGEVLNFLGDSFSFLFNG